MNTSQVATLAGTAPLAVDATTRRLARMSPERLLVEYYEAWREGAKRVAVVTLHEAELGVARVVREATT